MPPLFGPEMTITLAATNNAAQKAPPIHREVWERELIIRRAPMTFVDRPKAEGHIAAYRQL
jgi:hypothetical protein